MDWKIFWKFIERTNWILNILGTLGIISLLIALFEESLGLTLSIWFVIPISIFSFLLGYLLKGRVNLSSLLERIDFNYDGSPTEHGWIFPKEEESFKINFDNVSDGNFGKVLKIETNDRYALDFFVGPLTRLGKSIEYAIKPKLDAHIYAYIKVKSQNSFQTKTIWLHFGIGKEEPIQKSKGEWDFFITPFRQKGDWPIFRVDLDDAIKRTEGKEGWKFSQIFCFRLRGNLSIAYISIFK